MEPERKLIDLDLWALFNQFKVVYRLSAIHKQAIQQQYKMKPTTIKWK